MSVYSFVANLIFWFMGQFVCPAVHLAICELYKTLFRVLHLSFYCCLNFESCPILGQRIDFALYGFRNNPLFFKNFRNIFQILFTILISSKNRCTYDIFVDPVYANSNCPILQVTQGELAL